MRFHYIQVGAGHLTCVGEVTGLPILAGRNGRPKMGLYNVQVGARNLTGQVAIAGDRRSNLQGVCRRVVVLPDRRCAAAGVGEGTGDTARAAPCRLSTPHGAHLPPWQPPAAWRAKGNAALAHVEIARPGAGGAGN